MMILPPGWEPHPYQKNTWELTRGYFTALVSNKKPARDGIHHWRWEIRRFPNERHKPPMIEGRAHKRRDAIDAAARIMAKQMALRMLGL